MMTSLRRPPRRRAASAGLVRACCPAPAADLRRAFYLDTSSKIGLPESEKNVRLRRKVAQKNRDSAGYFAPFRCFVGSPTAWTAMVNARVKAFAKHNLERECRDETRVNLSHHRRLPAASVDRGSLRHGTTRHHCRGELWARKCHHDARPCRRV